MSAARSTTQQRVGSVSPPNSAELGSRGRARVERFDVAVGNAVIFANAFKPHDAGAGVVR